MDWLELIELIANGDGQNPILKDWLEQHGLYESVRDAWWPLQGKNPSQDIRVRPCTIEGEDGILLIEVRVPDGSGKSLRVNASAETLLNHIQICQAITQAAASLQLATQRPWGISRDHHYQLSNRIAWAWRLAHLGTRVVLLYLGYQVGHHENVVPREGWGEWLNVENNNGTSTPLLLLPRDYNFSPAVIEARSNRGSDDPAPLP